MEVKHNLSETKIPIILSIDVEPDPFLVNRSDPEPWKGYEATHPYLASLRSRFEEATGSPVHYTWCFRMDPQVAESYGSPLYAVDRYPGFVKDMERQKDAFGAHPHAYRWIEDRQMWLEDLANQQWVNECVDMSLQAYKKAFGTACETFRFGNFWMNTETVNLLEASGVRYELTVEPGLSSDAGGTLEKGYTTGRRPDYCRVARVPYEPGRDDFLKPAAPGSRSIKIIPITTGWLQLGRNLRARLQRLRENGFRYRWQHERLSMWRQWNPPNTFEQMLDRAIAVQKKPYLSFAIRSSIGVGKSFKNVDHCLQTLLNHPQRHRFVFSTPEEAMALLNPASLAMTSRVS
ncbi:MAG: hypothetical protein RQ736_03830 [Thiogranum sp.]|nr:hypothetical protein [Thiogranum sp.]